MNATHIDTVLVANRGEIACRIIRTLRAAGVRSVAVYSDADADARHVREADVAVPIGAAPARESYLVAEKILDAAARSGAQAIHPRLRLPVGKRRVCQGVRGRRHRLHRPAGVRHRDHG